MRKNVLLWKTVGSEQGNFTGLLTENYFYWSKDSKFASLKIGDFIFIVDIISATFLFASFDGDSGLKVENDESKDLTTVIDEENDEVIEARGSRWGSFIRFKILQKIDIPSKDWLNSFKYHSTNGTVYLFKYSPNKKTGENAFEPSKTVVKGELQNQLLELELSTEAEKIIRDCLEYSQKFTDASKEFKLEAQPDAKQNMKQEILSKIKNDLSIKEILRHVSQYIEERSEERRVG